MSGFITAVKSDASNMRWSFHSRRVSVVDHVPDVACGGQTPVMVKIEVES